ncbi:hypothetical protein [Janthinobacterium fluminis]|uniref:Uncharacterized protein n=1 Tax=Janthinobacterium fluminis TaxID=2987524 RepID=A0ABT5K415_9BURK|nr:hypothetical protein [Janthinobacterium fluminis]MDC8758831.1 hypothetical protein [Janthinobacterium fluminis]
MIRVKSGGGNTEAGMLLGRFIREKNLDIQVDEICASSCANYLFPAARRKIIPAGAILALHGTAYTTSLADDKRMREMLLDAGLPSSGIETEVEDLRLALAKQARLERQFSTDLKIAAAYYSDFKTVVEKSQSIIAKFNNKDASLFWWPSTKRLTSCYGIDNVEDFGRPPGIGSDGYSYAAKFSALITGDDNLPDCH